jgi:2-haloalkanoic acid dehalogenase type II
MRLHDFKVLSFDCYGTLIDWETGLLAALRPLRARLDPAPSNETMLRAFARFESRQQAATPTMPYRDVLSIVYKRLAEAWDHPVAWNECVTFGRSVGDWPAFADTAESLRYLKGHYRLVVLSNVDNASFAASGPRLGITFDAVFTAEDTGAYKPGLIGFRAMLDALAERDFAPDTVLHTAQSLFHDHVPAATLGLARCWIDRRAGRAGSGATPVPADAPAPDFRFASLADMVAAHKREAD